MEIREQLEKAVLSVTEKEDLKERVEQYHEQLFSKEGKPALDYLTNERRFDESTIRQFKLGCVVKPYPLDRYAQNAIAIPYQNNTGYRSIRFREVPGRTQMKSKYWQPGGSHLGIFNSKELSRPLSDIVIVEGEMDCAILAMLGYTAVGYPGVQSVKSWHHTLFEGYERVHIIGDGDEPGRGFAQKLSEMVPGPNPIDMPDGEDIGSLYCSGGRKAIEKLLGF